jgi:epoxyqueuosine reductase
MTLAAEHDLAQMALVAAVKQRAAELGFDRVGIAPARPSEYGDYLRRWVGEGRGGSMDYLSRRLEERTDVGAYLPGARSVVCLAINYHARLEEPPAEDKAWRARVARYALGDDYHELIKQRLYDLADWIRETVPGSRTRCSVDTAPVLERELAARAGIGWVGKHTGVLNRELGSWLLLGEVVTTVPLPADEPATDHCGTCTRCIDACPTGAITAPYQLDARRCISYLTIEHRDEIAPEVHRPIGDWLYGCDVCQDVCPHNRDAPAATDPALAPRFPSGSLDVREVLAWTDDEYRDRLRGSAMKRVKLPQLLRNARVIANNLDPAKEDA